MHRAARTVLVALVTALVLFGIVMLYSTSYAAFGERFLIRQLIWVGAGSIGALALWLVDYRKLGKASGIVLGLIALALAYLVAVYMIHRFKLLSPAAFSRLPLVTDRPIKGSFRWLRLAGLSVQPSEFAKPVLVLFLSDYYNRRARHITEFRRGFFRPMLISGVILALIFLGKDLSTTVVTGAVVFVLAFIAGVRLRYLVLLALAGICFAYVAIRFDPVRMRRMMSYQDPEKYQLRDGYQLWHSQLALGSGGTGGLGLTQSRLKQLYLPEAHTDFIVAIIGEELGFIATCCLVIAYGLVVATAFWIASFAPDRQGALLSAGLGVSIGIHAFVNVAVVSGFCPTTGVTAPFLSYGGSSMVATLLGVGLLLSVCRVSEAVAEERGTQSQRVADYGPVDVDDVAFRSC